MVKHTCDRCGQVFPKKYNLERHLNRKIRCILNETRIYSDDCDKILPLSPAQREGSLGPENLSKIERKCEDRRTFNLKLSQKTQNSGGKMKLNTKNPDILGLTKSFCRDGKVVDGFDSLPHNQSNIIQNVGEGLSHNINNKKSIDTQKQSSNKSTICEYCHTTIKQKRNLKRHLKSCIGLKSSEDEISTGELISELNRLKSKIQKLEERPPNVNNFNNVLQVLCVSSNDNYLDMLTEQVGFDKALGFIKDCALSEVSGDCKLLEKIYFTGKEPPIRYLDNNSRKIEFIQQEDDQEKQRIIDMNGSKIGQLLANNLQNSYLKGINYLTNRTLKERLCPNKFLEEYDLFSWNRHIYELSEQKYHKKIMKNLDPLIKQSVLHE